MNPQLPPRWIRYVVIAIAAVLPFVGFATTAFTAALAVKSPLLLITLEAPIRNLILAHAVPLVPFLVIATVRKSASAAVYFYLGRWYGDGAVRKLERDAPRAGTIVRAAEYGMRKAALPTVFLFPIPLVGVIAGAIKMRAWVFVFVTSLGALATAILARVLGDALARPVTAALRFLNENLIAATGVALLLVMASALWRWRRTRGRIERAAARERDIEAQSETIAP